MAHRLKNLNIERVALVPAGSNPHADVVLFKSHPEAIHPPKEQAGMLKKNIDISKLNPEEAAQMTALLAKSATDVSDPPPAPEEPSEEDILKSLPEAARALVAKAQKTADEATAAAKEATRQAEAATEAAMIEKAAREENEFIAKAVPFLKSYPGTTADSAKLLFRVKKALKDDAAYEALVTLMKAGDAALQSQMEETGSTVTATPEADQLSTVAKSIQEKEKISYSDAYAKAMEQHPELVAAARAARQSRNDDNDN